MKMIVFGFAAVCSSGFLAVAAPNHPSEVFVARARELYPTPAYRAMTNTLMRTKGFNYRVTASNDVPAKLVADTPTPNHVRWCRVPHLRNVRDLGGWNGLKTGRVYRGGYLFRADTDSGYDPATAKALKTLGIRTDLDLRGVKERDKQAKAAMKDFSGVGLVALNCPIVAYMRSFTDKRELFRRALLVFADAKNYPIYFHCKAGADRTGTLAFVLEGLCGANETDLQIDYELTSVSGDYRPRNAQYMKARNADCIHWMLDTVKSYPGKTLADRFANCAKALWGLTDDQIATIRKELMKGTGK